MRYEEGNGKKTSNAGGGTKQVWQRRNRSTKHLPSLRSQLSSKIVSCIKRMIVDGITSPRANTPPSTDCSELFPTRGEKARFIIS